MLAAGGRSCSAEKGEGSSVAHCNMVSARSDTSPYDGGEKRTLGMLKQTDVIADARRKM